MTYEEAIQNLISFMKKDFDSREYKYVDISYEIHPGLKYDKIVSSQSVVGFVCKKDNPKKGFKVGDILMAKSYNAPATNFARGSIFEPEGFHKRVMFCGIV